MRSVKAGKPLMNLIELCYHANRPLLLIGKHGIGKSEICEGAAAELKINYICRDLSLMEPPDLVGLPKMDGNVTRYLPPAFLPSDGKGILAFEELNRCPTYMRSPCLQLLTARILNDYRLPAGWLPVASINPPDDKYDVHELDPALLSRFVQVQVIPDRMEWLTWAKRNAIHDSVIAYVDRENKIFQDTSPRDWTAVSHLLTASEVLKSNKFTLQAALAGQVGRERASAFETFIKGGPTITPIGDILANYPTYEKRIKEWMSAGRMDIFDDYVYALKAFLQSEDNYRKMINSSPIWAAFGCFLKVIPPDLKEDLCAWMNSRYYAIPPMPTK